MNHGIVARPEQISSVLLCVLSSGNNESRNCTAQICAPHECKRKSTTCSSFNKKPRKFTSPSLLSTTNQTMTRFTFALFFVALLRLGCTAPVNTAGQVESNSHIESVGRFKSVSPVQSDGHIDSVGRQEECTRRCFTICSPLQQSEEVCTRQCFTLC